jgi:hypothetical protein
MSNLVNGVKVSAEDPNRVVTVTAHEGKTGQEMTITYTNYKVVGNGSFGVVFAAKMLPTKMADGTDVPEQEIAIKKVLQDKRFKNRELQIMRLVSHPNVVDLKAFFYSNGDKVGIAISGFGNRRANMAEEGRGLLEPGPRVRPRDRLPLAPLLHQAQADRADASGQALHVPAPAVVGVHPLGRHLPP